MLRIYILIFYILFSIVEVLPTTIAGRFRNLSAESLPKGVWIYGSNISSNLGSNDRIYNQEGKSVNNQSYFSETLTYGDLVNETIDPLEQELARAAFNVYGKNKDEFAGTVVNDVDVKTSANTFIMGRGMTDKLDLLLIFPVVTIKTSFNSRFSLSPSLQVLASDLRAEGQFKRADEILEKSTNALSQKLKESGYESTYPSEVTSLANIYLNLRYQGIKKSNFSLMFDSFVIIPQGETFKENQFIDLRLNEEQYSFKQGITVAYQLSASFDFLFDTYYHKRFSFEKEKRIPTSSKGVISVDLDNNVEVQYGDTYGFSSQVDYKLNPDFKFYFGQSFDFKNKDSYNGSKYDSYRYKYLEQKTEQRLGQAYIGIQFNTINKFIQNKFLIPIDLNLQYSKTNFGKNTFDSEMYALNLLGFYK